MYIHALPVSKKNVPALIQDPISLVRDIRELVDKHKDDNSELAITGKPLLFWPAIKNDPGKRAHALGQVHLVVHVLDIPCPGFMKPKTKPREKKVKEVILPKKEHPRARALGGKKTERIPCKICQVNALFQAK